MITNDYKRTLILDFDGSVFLPENIEKFDLRIYEEKLRYSAKFSDMTRLESIIKKGFEKYRTFFLGSGDFHHISYLLIKNIPQEKLQVVVFDNHTDNMFFPAGIHCGSWVYHASMLPHVSNISVFGIASRDLTGLDLIQNRFSVIKSGKVKYYCIAPVSKHAHLLSGNKITDISASRKNITDVVKEHLAGNGLPVYLSLDKDVFLNDVVRTTWDQGLLSEGEVLKCMEELVPYIISADIVGDISFYKYKNPLKRIMQWMDKKRQPPYNIEKERMKHLNINMKILSFLKGISN